MGKFDKDRHQKQLAVRYCIACGMIPFVEVVVSSDSDLSDSREALSDLDVLGVEAIADGTLRRTMFDCKSSSKLSAINRAFWAYGVCAYIGCDSAYVIMNKRAVFNHRLAALKIGVDLHDEASFEELGRSHSLDFDQDLLYQSSLERWEALDELYLKWSWSTGLYDTIRNQTPLSDTPEKSFRKLLMALKDVSGQIDPNKPEHMAIVFDSITSCFLLWMEMGRDMRRFYSSGMKPEEFEKTFRYYIWGGREAFDIRQRINSALTSKDSEEEVREFPAWRHLTKFAGLVISAPLEIFDCISIARELALRQLCEKEEAKEQKLREAIEKNKRARQFILSLAEYLVKATNLPTDAFHEVEKVLQLK